MPENDIIQGIKRKFYDNIKTQSTKKYGNVVKFADGVAYIEGINNAIIGQKLIFHDSSKRAREENRAELDIFGVVEDIDEFAIKCLVFGEEKFVKQGDKVTLSSIESDKDNSIDIDQLGEPELIKIPVHPDMLGKVLDPFCRQILNPMNEKDESRGSWYAYDKDDKFFIPKDKTEVLKLTIERPAPSIIDRDKIEDYLFTGTKVVDTMLPIGRGQRMLILGDRSTGKTSIALSAIINQNKINKQLNGINKNIITHKSETVYCIYVGIGKKAAEIKAIVDDLKANNALDYTVVMSCFSNDAAPLLYIIPYTAMTLAEYFREIGKNVLIVFDDLLKHANAYRQISLILKRPPGRDAYPGDIFYLHSRLLERAGKLKNENLNSKEYKELVKEFTIKEPTYQIKSGGSITALPIVETKQGDYSSYIATNLISITDGQIYLDTKLKDENILPAVNVGLSVSRIGSNAQTKEMKEVSKGLKEILAIYREKLKYASFGIEQDDDKEKEFKEYGKALVTFFKQEKFYTISDPKELALKVFAAREKLLNVFENEKEYVECTKILLDKSNENKITELKNLLTKYLDYLDSNEKEKVQQTEKIKTTILDELNKFIKAAITKNIDLENFAESNDLLKELNSEELTCFIEYIKDPKNNTAIDKIKLLITDSRMQKNNSKKHDALGELNKIIASIKNRNNI